MKSTSTLKGVSIALPFERLTVHVFCGFLRRRGKHAIVNSIPMSNINLRSVLVSVVAFGVLSALAKDDGFGFEQVKEKAAKLAAVP